MPPFAIGCSINRWRECLAAFNPDYYFLTWSMGLAGEFADRLEAPCITLMRANCLPLLLCKESVKESTRHQKTCCPHLLIIACCRESNYLQLPVMKLESHGLHYVLSISLQNTLPFDDWYRFRSAVTSCIRCFLRAYDRLSLVFSI